MLKQAKSKQLQSPQQLLPAGSGQQRLVRINFLQPLRNPKPEGLLCPWLGLLGDRAEAAEGRSKWQRPVLGICCLLRATCVTCHHSSKEHAEAWRGIWMPGFADSNGANKLWLGRGLPPTLFMARLCKGEELMVMGGSGLSEKKIVLQHNPGWLPPPCSCFWLTPPVAVVCCLLKGKQKSLTHPAPLLFFFTLMNFVCLFY